MKFFFLLMVLLFTIGALWGIFGGMYRAAKAKDWSWFWAILLLVLTGILSPIGILVGWIYLLGSGKRRATQGIESSANAKATFCGSCGVALAPAVQFCGSCGGPVSS
jgi:zinc transporter ZupT